MLEASNDSMRVTWSPEARLAVVRFSPGVTVQKRHADLLVERFTEWAGAEGQTFGVLADTTGVPSADAGCRATMSDFCKRHRRDMFIAAANMGTVMRVVVDMFRIGTGIDIRGFPDEERARAWLREKGIQA